MRSRSQLGRALTRVTWAGCLAMVFVTFTNSPVLTQLFIELGATDVHFGFLNGLPMVMLGVQYLGAYVCGRVNRRKPWVVITAISARFLYVPMAALALVPGIAERAPVIVWLLLLTAVQGALANFMVPLWFSWMGDLIPQRILGRYWGNRLRSMTAVWTVASLLVGAVTYFGAALPARVLFAILVAPGTLTGVLDIVLFLRVREPENVLSGDQDILRLLLEPVRHPEYRSLVVMVCAFSGAAMLAAAFMYVFCLDTLQMPVWKVQITWCTVGLGSVVVARTWGFIADRHGHRPIIVLCVLFKPFVCVAFLLSTPGNAMVLLGVVFFFDSILNAGYEIAVNGYMLKMAPRENRSMFIASIMALAGLAGGLGAVLGGLFLENTQAFSVVLGGRSYGNYHLLFAISFLLRALCIPLAVRIREPRSATTLTVAGYLRGVWPLRMFLFPIGLYRRVRNREEQGSQEQTQTR